MAPLISIDGMQRTSVIGKSSYEPTIPKLVEKYSE